MKFDNVIAVRPTKTVYRDGNRTIKVFNKNYSKADVLQEALNQARVEDAGVLIPKLLEVTMVDDSWAIVTEYVEGKTLDQLIRENPDKYDEYLDMFVDLQISVQAKTAPRLFKLKDKMSGKLDLANIDDSRRYELKMLLEAMPKHNKICHGDFNPSNVIIGDDGKAYILDWSHTTQGNASADVARTYLLFWLSGENEVAEKYLDLFCEKSGTAKQYVQKWMPIVAASQSVKGNEKEREFLLSWVDVLD